MTTRNKSRLVVASLALALASGCILKMAPFLLFGINPFDLPPPCDQTDAGCPAYDAGPQNYGCQPGDTCNGGTVTTDPPNNEPRQ